MCFLMRLRSQMKRKLPLLHPVKQRFPRLLLGLKLSDEIGIKKATAQLGVPYYTLADWRHRQNIHGDQAHVGSGHKRETGDEKDRRIRELERENAELARANEILQEALGFFAKNRKK